MLGNHNIHQMQARYFPMEDRLFFRLNTIKQREFRFWFTRRYSDQLWQALLTVLDDFPTSKDKLTVDASTQIKPEILSSMTAASSAASPKQTAHSGLSVEAEQLSRAFEHEKITADADFKAEYVETPETEYPLGRKPILAARLKIKLENTGKYILCIHPMEGEGIEIQLTTRLTHLLCQLLSQGIGSSNWALDCQLPQLPSTQSESHAIH